MGITEEQRSFVAPYFHKHRKLRAFSSQGHFVESDLGRLLDLNSGYWTVILGHGVTMPASDSSESLGYWGDLFNFDQQPAESLCETLCALSGFKKAILTCSGSSAVDTALRIAFMVGRNSKRSKLVSLRRAYHGSTALALACNGLLYGSPLSEQIKSIQLRPVYGPVTDSLTDPTFARALEEVDWQDVAAFVFEPVQAVGGLRSVDADWLEQVIVKAKEHEAITIADEVTTGMFRGNDFLYWPMKRERADITIVGKPLTNGEFPLAAVLLSDKMWGRIESAQVPERERYIWGETYGGHPIGCKIANSVFSQLTASTLERKRDLAISLHNVVRSYLSDQPMIRELRTPSGFLAAGIALKDPTRLRDIEQELWGKGIRIGVESDALLIVPMFTMTEDTIASAVETITQTIQKLC